MIITIIIMIFNQIFKLYLNKMKFLIHDVYSRVLGKKQAKQSITNRNINAAQTVEEHAKFQNGNKQKETKVYNERTKSKNVDHT